MIEKKRMPVLQGLVLVVLAAACVEGSAIGLGTIQVQSALGQALHVTIPFFGGGSNNIAELCPRGRVETLDGSLIAKPQFNVKSGVQSSLIVTTTTAINEPALTVGIELGCSTSIRRNYQVLLDPVVTQPVTRKMQAVRQTIPLSDDPMGIVQPSIVHGARALTLPTLTAQEADSGTPNNRKSVTRAAPGGTVQSKQSKSSTRRNGLTTSLDTRKAASRTRAAPVASMGRNVLRLSSPDMPSDSFNMTPSLKMSDSISIREEETDPEKMQEIRAAQLRFAAVMRGEDTVKNAEAGLQAAQETIRVLTLEAEQLQQQSLEEARLFEEQQKQSLNINWFIGLAALLGVSLIAMLWLAWRLHRASQLYRTPFWTDDLLDEEEEGSPFSDTITDLSETSSLQEEEVAQPVASHRPRRFNDPENDATFGKTVGNRVRMRRSQNVVPMTATAAAAAPETDAPEEAAQEVPQVVAPVVPRYQKRSEMLKVEEISDAMQEAEFWMSLNNPQRAINVLEQYGDLGQPNSPMPWLYLLELYRGVNDRIRYEVLRRRFRTTFNSKAPAWDAEPGTSVKQGLEDYPGLLNQICDVWDSHEVVPLLEGLLFDNRGGDREGFDLPVYLDLIMLMAVAYELHSASPFGGVDRTTSRWQRESDSET